MDSPDLLPIGLDDRCERICFVSMSPGAYRASTFLDNRAHRTSRDRSYISIGELLDAQRRSPSTNGPHYIMHGAFCCSTLLTRYLDLIAFLFVLREPDILRQVLLAKNSSLPCTWNALLSLSVRLLSRTYKPHQLVLVKCNDLCNYLAEPLLALDDRSKAVLVGTKLSTFLLAILKSDNRRRWMRSRLESIARLAKPRTPILAYKRAVAMGDAQAGALLWLSTMHCYRSLLRKMGKRLFVLDGDDIANHPRKALSSLMQFLGITLPSDRLDEIAGHWSGRKHAKDALIPFDAKRRARDLIDAKKLYGAEAGVGIEWAQTAASRWLSESPFPSE
jgi:hypothetical protein